MILTTIAALASLSSADDQRARTRRVPRPVAAAPNATLGDVRMHLFYQESERLSPDISPPTEFTGWNTIIGGGSAVENASDLLVVAELRAQGEQNVNRPATITVRAGRRLLGQRTFPSALTGNNGRAYLPLWLNDVTCAGRIQVEVTFGRERKTETLALNCGE